jgi:hypothetical protein
MSKVKDVLSAFRGTGFYRSPYWKQEYLILIFPDSDDPYHDFCIKEEELELVGLFLLELAKALKDDTRTTEAPALP